jgi:hypothetical protein
MVSYDKLLDVIEVRKPLVIWRKLTTTAGVSAKPPSDDPFNIRHG